MRQYFLKRSLNKQSVNIFHKKVILLWVVRSNTNTQQMMIKICQKIKLYITEKKSYSITAKEVIIFDWSESERNFNTLLFFAIWGSVDGQKKKVLQTKEWDIKENR